MGSQEAYCLSLPYRRRSPERLGKGSIHESSMEFNAILTL